MACITLLSDFGLQEASVAIAKGILMQHTPAIPIIDISHEIQPFNAGQAAYNLGSAYAGFPRGTIHVLLFDLFSETTPRLVLCEHNGHYFLAPDNGLLPLALGPAVRDALLCFELTKELGYTDWLSAVGKTTHSLQSKNIGELGFPPVKLKVTKDKSTARFEAGVISCEAIHIDHYENVVINLTRTQFGLWGANRPFRLSFVGMEEIDTISNSYHDVREGFKLCRFNSTGYLEICVNRGRAASLFGLRLGGKNNDIKITFE
jgi:hypothetical protein